MAAKTPAQYVFVVSFGERCEGHTPASVHSTLRGAVAASGRGLKIADFTKVDRRHWMRDIDPVDQVWITKFAVD